MTFTLPGPAWGRRCQVELETQPNRRATGDAGRIYRAGEEIDVVARSVTVLRYVT